MERLQTQLQTWQKQGRANCAISATGSVGKKFLKVLMQLNYLRQPRFCKCHVRRSACGGLHGERLRLGEVGELYPQKPIKISNV